MSSTTFGRVLYELTITIFLANSADDKLALFFFQKIGFDSSNYLSPKETFCLKCQIIFSGENKKNYLECRLLKFTEHVQH